MLKAIVIGVSLALIANGILARYVMKYDDKHVHQWVRLIGEDYRGEFSCRCGARRKVYAPRHSPQPDPSIPSIPDTFPETWARA